MRILHLMNSVESVGNGIINTAVDLAVEQRLAGHDVAFVAAGGGYEPLLQRLGIGHYQLPPSRKDVLRFLSAHGRAFRDFRPDIVHAHMRAGLLAMWPHAKLGRIPVIGHLQNVQEWQSRLYTIADRVIAVSGSVAESMKKAGIDAKKLRVVFNGPIGTHRLDDSHWKPAELQHPAIITVAGMYERKGISDLIEAFNMIAGKFPQASLYIVGEGPSRSKFESEAAASPAAARIHFEGFCLDPRPYMRAAEIFVLASHRESLGLVLAEARAEGCPIVGTSVDGIPEAMDHGRVGILVPPSQPRALADALERLLSDDQLRERFARESKIGLEPFSTTRMATEVQAVYHEVLDGRKS